MSLPDRWENKFETQYLSFQEAHSVGNSRGELPKTKQVLIFSAMHPGEYLGCIRWYGGWRQYTFFPEAGTLWNPDCLENVKLVIKYLMDERKKEKDVLGHQIIKQPNGKFCVFSTIVDDLILYDGTPKEIEDYYAEEAAEKARDDTRKAIAAVLAGEQTKIYHQFAMEWREVSHLYTKHIVRAETEALG